MKTLKYIGLGLVTLGLFSCTKTEYDDFETTNGGSADFSSYIAVGNSLTQGYQDGGLHNEYNQQDNSFPAIIAKQMGTTFVQPLVEGDGSGYRKLLSLAPNITSVAPDARFDFTNQSTFHVGTGWSTWDKNKKYNNLGVAGIKLNDCVAGGTGNLMAVSFNHYGAYLDLGPNPMAPMSYLDMLKTRQATFFTNWLGNNDVLGWSTVGGDDTKGVLTPVGEFETKYNDILDAFSAMGAKGVCATLPDVTAIPYFTTVPHNPIPMDAATASQTNSAYASYNGGLDSYQAGGAISAAEVSRRKINFTASETNAIVIEDESLTSLPGLPNIRHATAADLIILPASSEIGKQLDPSNPASIYGVGVAFADSLVLTESEVSQVQNHTNLLNNAIRTSASNHGVAVADMYSYMFELQAGMTFDGVEYGAKYIEGGAFSLDGVHPNTRGYAIIANKFIETINVYYGSNLRPVPVQNYRGIIFP
jgi:lysophospholipase L1-like esterase